MSKPIICVDFDGVINPYSRGWQDGELYEEDVVPGFFEWATKAREHFTLVVYSSRSKLADDRRAMRDWLGNRLIAWKTAIIRSVELPPYLDDFEFSAEKPPAFLTIDDRAIRFDGDWTAPELEPETLLAFKPWTQRVPAPKTWKIIAVDNFNRETVADFLVTDNIRSEKYGKVMEAALQADVKENDSRWYRLVPGDHRLSRGMADFEQEV